MTEFSLGLDAVIARDGPEDIRVLQPTVDLIRVTLSLAPIDGPLAPAAAGIWLPGNDASHGLATRL